jgi:hypothetical protein
LHGLSVLKTKSKIYLGLHWGKKLNIKLDAGIVEFASW